MSSLNVSNLLETVSALISSLPEQEKINLKYGCQFYGQKKVCIHKGAGHCGNFLLVAQLTKISAS